MELREQIEDINNNLLTEFGKELDGQPRFRVVFSDDQYEKRLTNFTDEGFELIHPEVRLLPKYKQYVREKYILERLVPVPEGIETDLTTKVTYEPAWVFQDRHGSYLPPFFEGCKHVILSLYEAMGRKGQYVKYKDKNISAEERAIELKKVEDDLFGNETVVGDHLAYGTGIVVPGNKLVH